MRIQRQGSTCPLEPLWLWQIKRMRHHFSENFILFASYVMNLNKFLFFWRPCIVSVLTFLNGKWVVPPKDSSVIKCVDSSFMLTFTNCQMYTELNTFLLPHHKPLHTCDSKKTFKRRTGVNSSTTKSSFKDQNRAHLCQQRFKRLKWPCKVVFNCITMSFTLTTADNGHQCSVVVVAAAAKPTRG